MAPRRKPNFTPAPAVGAERDGEDIQARAKLEHHGVEMESEQRRVHVDHAEPFDRAPVEDGEGVTVAEASPVGKAPSYRPAWQQRDPTRAPAPAEHGHADAQTCFPFKPSRTGGRGR